MQHPGATCPAVWAQKGRDGSLYPFPALSIVWWGAERGLRAFPLRRVFPHRPRQDIYPAFHPLYRLFQ